jgi:predicted dinucleotide-binding enzyme
MAKVGVIGSAVVGQTLASGFKKHGHDVRIGSRTPARLADFSRSSGIQAGTVGEVASWADTVVLAVSGDGAESAVSEIGPANLKGKVVIDTTNPIAKEAPEDGVIKYFTGPNSSLMERLQRTAPEARFVKAFNSVGAALMVNPSFPGGRPTMFYCGNDGSAKAEVLKIIEQFGWEGADMGSAKAARAIEPLAQLWCIPGFLRNEWGNHAFHLMKK